MISIAISEKEKVIKILTNWIKYLPEAILCQRDSVTKITFSPVLFSSYNNSVLSFYVRFDKTMEKLLITSKNHYKTASLITHQSSRSNPTKNKGILFIGNLLDWQKASGNNYPKTSNRSLWKSTDSLLLVKFDIYRISYWSGINFGSYYFKKSP